MRQTKGFANLWIRSLFLTNLTFTLFRECLELYVSGILVSRIRSKRTCSVTYELETQTVIREAMNSVPIPPLK